MSYTNKLVVFFLPSFNKAPSKDTENLLCLYLWDPIGQVSRTHITQTLTSQVGLWKASSWSPFCIVGPEQYLLFQKKKAWFAYVEQSSIRLVPQPAVWPVSRQLHEPILLSAICWLLSCCYSGIILLRTRDSNIIQSTKIHEHIDWTWQPMTLIKTTNKVAKMVVMDGCPDICEYHLSRGTKLSKHFLLKHLTSFSGSPWLAWPSKCSCAQDQYLVLSWLFVLFFLSSFCTKIFKTVKYFHCITETTSARVICTSNTWLKLFHQGKGISPTKEENPKSYF